MFKEIFITVIYNIRKLNVLSNTKIPPLVPQCATWIPSASRIQILAYLALSFFYFLLKLLMFSFKFQTRGLLSLHLLLLFLSFIFYSELHMFFQLSSSTFFFAMNPILQFIFIFSLSSLLKPIIKRHG